MSGEFSESWLSLREPADADARAADLVAMIPGPVRTIRDLGCGTGSLARWLAPLLPVPQSWILADRDPALLSYAEKQVNFDGVGVRTALGDVTTLTASELRGTDLVTCSALLDLLTAEEVTALAEVCAASRTSALFTLSVTGEVRFEPELPLDREIEAAFNEHQRRNEGGRRLLGPDAPIAAVTAFEKVGATVVTRPSPWRLGPHRAALTAEWLDGWLAAATEQRPELQLAAYREERSSSLPVISVGHLDLLAIFH